ncbi:MAG: CRISPR-associated DxTHG motif protein [Paramuribaculum sp.]|nr:CRISPR-associated DxTHG motif protein [Paramuribaculum sp.]MDE6488021.1 CRISPR-associated DxTHG motif protein [Paramuribaculum sp.]
MRLIKHNAFGHSFFRAGVMIGCRTVLTHGFNFFQVAFLWCSRWF